MAVQVLTDSTSCMDEGLRKEYGIRILSLCVSFEDESFKEIEISNEVFYKKMEQKGIPKSSQPSIDDMVREMKEVVSNGDSLLCIFISSEMSGTYSTAHVAKNMILEEYKDAKIEIVDSRDNCMQLGFAAIQAAKAAKEGKSLKEVKLAAEENLKKSRFLFIPENLVYLRKGGRIGGASALIGNILKIIPILTVENGVTSVYAKVRTKKKAVATMVGKMINDIKNFGLGEVVVHHINCYDEAKELANVIMEKFNIKVLICDIGPVIGLHVGPGAIGIAYYTEKALR
ncbi:DegV family protein [Clostridium guangxiense]|uniref:DegV family protein n=1 Tax=Clostridium guangxiense TaxID=1662055 RepID=UPI001E2FE46D|nr:DegV family protein [Clostridium guangxiense]MCD2348662.1 DegV family protein [Clostridium guangxiense]